MRVLLEQWRDENARRAWIGVGAPILGLVLVIIALAIAVFSSFASQQDQAYADNTRRLAASAVDARATNMRSMVVEYANWDASVTNIENSFNAGWINANIYSSIVDAMFVFRADGTVLYAWFADKVGEREALQAESIAAAINIPELRRLARAERVADTAASTHFLLDGRWGMVSIAPVTPASDAARHAARAPQTFIAAVDLLEASEFAATGAMWGLEGLTISDRVKASHGMVHLPLYAADGSSVGALEWRHAFPGAAAFERKIAVVIGGLLAIGLLTLLIARRLVLGHIEAIASARAATESSEQKSEFLGRVSSELRSPLDAVISYAELIREEVTSPTARDDARRIIVAARELSAMLGDIIDQSEIDVGKLRLKPGVVPVEGLLSEVQGLMHPVAKAEGVDIAVSMEASALYAHADRARLRQCLLNITGNAVKFSPRGGVVRLHATRVDDMIQIEVADSGPGIGDDEARGIFRPFTQANPATAAVYGGMGLGLSIASALARQMGGDISMISTGGEGSTFYLRVPTASARALSAA